MPTTMSGLCLSIIVWNSAFLFTIDRQLTFKTVKTCLLDVARIGEGDLVLEGVTGSSDRMLKLLAEENELNADCTEVEKFKPSHFEQTQEKERSVLTKSSYVSFPACTYTCTSCQVSKS